MNNTQLGVLIGFILGVAWVAFGFQSVLLGIIIGAVGYFVGRVLDGQIDLQAYIQRYSRG
ncbi:MAG TPA: DUF2273 domain-containing protein [Anaerolineae bacterium]|nr:DUF2273 domain-containing protein [Anaerolineae bacterium]